MPGSRVRSGLLLFATLVAPSLSPAGEADSPSVPVEVAAGAYLDDENSGAFFGRAVVGPAGDSRLLWVDTVPAPPGTAPFRHQLTRFDLNAQPVWTVEMPPPTVAGTPVVEDVLLDAQGSTIGAVHLVSLGDDDLWITKHDADGRLVWQYTRVDGQVTDRPLRIAPAPDGDLLVAALHDYAWGLVRLDPSGNERWMATFGSERDLISGGAYIGGLAVDGDGNAYLAGTILPIESLTHNAIVASFDPSGTQLWVREIEPGAFTDALLDGDGSLVLIGTARSFAGTWLLALDPATGATNWDVRLPGLFLDALLPGATGGVLAVGHGGIDATATARLTRQGNSQHIVLAAFDTDGTMLWDTRHSDPLDRQLAATSIVAAPGGGALIAAVAGVGEDREFTHVLFDGQGCAVWESRRAQTGISLVSGFGPSVGITPAGRVVSMTLRVDPEWVGGNRLTRSGLECRVYETDAVAPTGVVKLPGKSRLKFKKSRIYERVIGLQNDPPVPVASKSTARVKVRNNSREAKLVLALGPLEAPFEGGGTYTLGPREKLRLTLRYRPTQAGRHEAQVVLRTSDPATPQRVFELVAQSTGP